MKITSKILVVLLMAGAGKLFAQGGVVSAPVLEAEVASSNTILAEQASAATAMQGVMTALESADNEYKTMMKKATWMRNLQTAQRLIVLVENVVCTTRDINARLGLVSNSCIYRFNYDVSVMKISMAADYLSIIMTDGVSMTSGERMTTLDQAIKAFEHAQKELIKLNYQLNSRMILNARLQNSKTNVHQLFASKNYYN